MGCAECHRGGVQGDDENPPLYGARSFNDGAGLANDLQLASWLKVAMSPIETDLADQEALDLAGYINSHEQPQLRLGEHLPRRDALGQDNGDVSP